MPVNTLVITGYGTNCHKESAQAALLAGADKADVVHFADIVSAEVVLEDYQFLVFPGGFMDGDDLGAAQAAAQRWRHISDANGRPMLESMRAFIEAGKLILGICNGFQLLVKLGVLPAIDGKLFERQVSLAHNSSGRFEDRWVNLIVNSDSPCVFTKNISSLYVPVRHGEGRLVARDAATLDALRTNNLVVFSYADPDTGKVTDAYPYNPNGSPFGIAGICDPSGRVLGMMPHPEAYLHPTNHPSWTRGTSDVPGTVLFDNAVAYLRANPPA